MKGQNGAKKPGPKRVNFSAAGKRLDETLDEIKMTPQELAGKVGCDVSMINKFIAGKSGIGSELLMDIVSVVDVDPEWLMTGKYTPRKPGKQK